MREDVHLTDNFTPRARRPLKRSEARLKLVAAVFTVLISIAVCIAAVLAPAPAPAVPLVVAVCVGAPMFASWEAPTAIAALRADRTWGKELVRLRRSLEKLPETEHPLGL